MDFRAFRGLRPPVELVDEVACPPYDVVNSEEARERVVGKPRSLLHVTRPEVDLPADVDVHADVVYETAAANFRRFLAEGTLVQDAAPAYYIYRQVWGSHVQTGVMGAASVDEYDRGLVKKHEHTRRDKEDDRARHTDVLGANAGPVFLAYHADPALDALTAAVTDAPPTAEVEADGVRHILWAVTDSARIDAFRAAYARVSAFYVADGHHRAASASRTRALRQSRNPGHTGDESYNRFMAVVFPHDQLRILAYNRVVRDLNGLDRDGLLAAVGERFEVTPASDSVPTEPQTFRMLLDGAWHALRPRAGTFPAGDPVRSLDVAILQDNLLAPVLGIGDPRTDQRIDFVGGIRGTGELERRAASGWAIAFSMYPTSLEQLMSVADAGQVMPPKSTWFEPKLRSGLVVHSLVD